MTSGPQSTLYSTQAWKGLISLLFLFLLIYFNYFLERKSFEQLVSIYIALFTIYLLFLHPYWDQHKNHFHQMIFLAIAARLIILFAVPNLSDDYHRFIWDGKLILNGMNPFDLTPAEFMNAAARDKTWQTLFENVNSTDYFSIYPPVNQFVFYLANLFSPHSTSGAVVVMKLIFFGAELSTIFLFYKLCQLLAVDIKNVLFYALNPLVIIEFCGNLHFEALMIPFLLLSILLLIRKKTIWSALAFAGAVLTKLHPLMLLPFIVKYLGWRKGVQFSIVSLVVSGVLLTVLFLPLDGASVRFDHFMSSFRLYFESFEFNAGIYYIFRWIGFQSYGYNPIDKVGKLMLAFNVLVLIWLFIRMRRTIPGLIGIFFIAYLAYYLFATTVHPWYILPLLPLALLANYKSIVAWTAVIILSYIAYSQPDWHENFGLLTLEYTCIFAFLLYEFNDRNKLNEIIR